MMIKMYRLLKGFQLGNRNMSRGQVLYSNEATPKQIEDLKKRKMIQEVPIDEPEPIKEPPPVQFAKALATMAVAKEEPEPENEAADGGDEDENPEQPREADAKPVRRSRPTLKKKKAASKK